MCFSATVDHRVEGGVLLRLFVYFSLIAVLSGASEAVAQAYVLKECGTRYQQKKAANELNGQSWQEFLKVCRENFVEVVPDAADPTEAEAAEAEAPTPVPLPTPLPLPPLWEPKLPEYNNTSQLASATESIDVSAYAFLYARGSEAPGYGLYSYAILRNGSQRSAALLKQIFRKVRNVDFITASRIETNIIYVPSTREKGKRRQDDYYKNDENIRRFLSREPKSSSSYDFEIAKQLIAAICDRPADEVKSLCQGDENGGPYIITYSKQIGSTSPLPPPFLLVDLTPVDESAFDTLVSSYLVQVRADKFDDRTKIDTFRNKLLTLILRSARSLEPITAALLGIVHQVKTADSKDAGKK
jgi:hypothetical protein